MKWIIILITWIIVGILSFLAMCIIDMRGKRYDENYFETGDLKTILFVIVMGYISPVLIVIALPDWTKIRSRIKNRFTRLMYKIANIGLKDKEDK